MNTVLDFIKKQVVLIACGAVVLVGLGFFVWGLMVDQANAKGIEQVQRIYDSANRLSQDLIHDDDVARIKAAARQINAQTRESLNRAYESTARPVLFERVFPTPGQQSYQIYFSDFADSYCKGIEALLKAMNSDDRLSDAEVDRIMENYKGGQTRARSDGGMMMGYGGGRDGSVMKGTSEYGILEEKMQERARQISVYANTDSFSCYSYWKTQPRGEIEVLLPQCWYSQLGYWIQEDVALSIKNINQAKNVLENPVKRLIGISFNGESVGDFGGSGGGTRGTSSRQGGAAAGRLDPKQVNLLPTYVMELSDTSSSQYGGSRGAATGLVGMITTPVTERKSNDLIDVVHFELAVVIDRSSVISFINELQSQKTASLINSDVRNPRNQIAVLDIIVEPIELEEETNARYIYGSGALGILRLNCEYFFVKRGYDSYKPDQIKELLNPSTQGGANKNSAGGMRGNRTNYIR